LSTECAGEKILKIG